MLGPVAEAVAAEGEEQHQDEDQQDGAGDEEEESFLFHLLVVALGGVEGVESILNQVVLESWCRLVVEGVVNGEGISSCIEIVAVCNIKIEGSKEPCVPSVVTPPDREYAHYIG